ncbi:MAG: hypothetical protein ABIG34_03890 [Candidatus Peregrinibacteria bacterium]
MAEQIIIGASFSTMQRLKELANNLRYLSSKERGADVQMQIAFATPLSITPIAAVINDRSLSHAGQFNSYLHTVHFPEGVSECKEVGTYFPIIHLQMEGLTKADMSRKLESLHSTFLDLLNKNIIADRQFLELVTKNTFGFLLGELFDNIEEHSQAKNVYLFAQYWPKTNSCEICLLDDGQGLLGSLRGANRDVSSNEDAMRKILNYRLSAKDEFGDIRRGTGLWNTRLAIINQQLKGEFLILSGDTAFVQSEGQNGQFLKLSETQWNGTIVMMRLVKPVVPFSIYDYVR